MPVPTPPPTPTRLRIGVMLEEVQLADIMGIDIFGNLANPYVAGLAALDPQKYSQWTSHAITIQLLFIASTLAPTRTTPLQTPASDPTDLLTGPGFHFLPNTTYDTCPRDLDILLIGGSSPSHRPAAADRFMKEAWVRTPVVMTTCIGGLWLASAGLLEGRRCTTNKEFLGMAREMYPGTEWVRQRWVVEERGFEVGDGGKGELWTAGGAGAGVDMIAHYCQQRFGHEFVDAVALQMLELNPGGKASQFYD